MDAQRCWAGRRKGARKGVMGEMYGRGRKAEVNRRAFNRGGMAANVGVDLVMLCWVDSMMEKCIT